MRVFYSISSLAFNSWMVMDEGNLFSEVRDPRLVVTATFKYAAAMIDTVR